VWKYRIKMVRNKAVAVFTIVTECVEPYVAVSRIIGKIIWRIERGWFPVVPDHITVEHIKDNMKEE